MVVSNFTVSREISLCLEKEEDRFRRRTYFHLSRNHSTDRLQSHDEGFSIKKSVPVFVTCYRAAYIDSFYIIYFPNCVDNRLRFPGEWRYGSTSYRLPFITRTALGLCYRSLNFHNFPSVLCSFRRCCYFY